MTTPINFSNSAKRWLLGSFLLGGALQTLSAQTTLLDDTFNRGTTGSPVFFDGSSPTTTGGTAAGQTWTNHSGGGTSDNGSTNGSELTLGPTTGVKTVYSIELATAAQGWAANTLYTFSATLPQFTLTGGAQAEVGFEDGSLAEDSQPVGGVYFSGSTAQWDYYSSTTGTKIHQAVTDSSAVNTASGTEFTITFNTATDVENFYIGSSGASGTVDFSLTDSSLPNLSSGLYAYVELQDQGVSAAQSISFSNISVTETALTPEPSTFALFALGDVVLAGWAMNRRRFSSI